MTDYTLTHLKQLEAESIHIFREVVAEFSNPVMLYSIGKGLIGVVAFSFEGVRAGEATVPFAARGHNVQV